MLSTACSHAHMHIARHRNNECAIFAGLLANKCILTYVLRRHIYFIDRMRTLGFEANCARASASKRTQHIYFLSLKVSFCEPETVDRSEEKKRKNDNMAKAASKQLHTTTRRAPIEARPHVVPSGPCQEGAGSIRLCSTWVHACTLDLRRRAKLCMRTHDRAAHAAPRRRAAARHMATCAA
jgi:hypothetical protein